MKCDNEELKKVRWNILRKRRGYKKLFIYGKFSGSRLLNQFNAQEIINLNTFLGHNT